jgi:hypothetical protein
MSALLLLLLCGVGIITATAQSPTTTTTTTTSGLTTTTQGPLPSVPGYSPYGFVGLVIGTYADNACSELLFVEISSTDRCIPNRNNGNFVKYHCLNLTFSVETYYSDVNCEDVTVPTAASPGYNTCHLFNPGSTTSTGGTVHVSCLGQSWPALPPELPYVSLNLGLPPTVTSPLQGIQQGFYQYDANCEILAYAAIFIPRDVCLSSPHFNAIYPPFTAASQKFHCTSTQFTNKAYSDTTCGSSALTETLTYTSSSCTNATQYGYSSQTQVISCT